VHLNTLLRAQDDSRTDRRRKRPSSHLPWRVSTALVYSLVPTGRVTVARAQCLPAATLLRYCDVQINRTIFLVRPITTTSVATRWAEPVQYRCAKFSGRVVSFPLFVFGLSYSDEIGYRMDGTTHASWSKNFFFSDIFFFFFAKRARKIYDDARATVRIANFPTYRKRYD
jgi:hypothetical protein